MAAFRLARSSFIGLTKGRLLVDISPLRGSQDFRRLWTAQLLSWCGRQVVVVAMPYQVYVLTHSSLAVGALGLIQILPIVMAGLYGGGFADRFDRRLVQAAGKSVGACGSLCLAVGAAAGTPPLGLVFGVAAVTAAAWAIDQSARAATLPRLIAPRMLPSALGLTQITYQTAAVGGPVLGGVVIAAAGLRWAYLIDVMAFVPASVLLLTLASLPPTLEGHVTFGWKAPAEGLRYVRNNRLILGLFAADLIAMTFGMPTAVFPALALTVLGYGPALLGLLYAGPAIGALVGSVLSGWVGSIDHQARAVVWAIAIWGLAIAAFGQSGSILWLALPLLAIAGVADLISAILRSTILQLTVPDSMRGRMSALHSMVTTTGPRLGDLEAGGVAALVSPTFSVISGGLACVVGIGLLAATLPELRHQRSPAHHSGEPDADA